MVALNPGDRKQLLSLLEKLPEMATERSRRNLLIDADLEAIGSRIDVSSSPFAATREIVTVLCKCGHMPRSCEPLGSFLLEVRRIAGPDKQELLDRWLEEYCLTEPLSLEETQRRQRLWEAETEARLAAERIPNNLPYSGAISFVGRDRELAELHQLLNKSENKPVAIVGMGGAGKTELALQYAQQYRTYYPGGLMWLNGKRDLVLEIIGFARSQLGIEPSEDLNTEQQVAFCWRQFEGDEPVLVVADDLADYKQARPYLPPNDPKFRLLLTRRSRFGKGIVALSLDVLKPLAAMKLLVACVGRNRVCREARAARDLLRWLGYLPLGVELVGRFLDLRPDWTLAKMSVRLEEKRLEAKALAQQDEEMTAQHESLIAAFELSWEDLSENAQQLGCLLSWFAGAPIPWYMVESCWKNGEEARDKDLVCSNLLQHLETNIYQLHPLIREFFRWKTKELSLAQPFWGLLGWLRKENRSLLVKKVCNAAVAIEQTIPGMLTLQDVARVKDTIPHIEDVAKYWLEEIEKKDNIIFLLGGLGRFYEGQGLYERAQFWREACVAAARKFLGNDHPSMAMSLHNLASLCYLQGRYEEAEPLFLQALELWRKFFGNNHPSVATGLNNLASLYYSQGRYEEAELLHLQVLDLLRNSLSGDHLDVATSLNNLASLYHSQERYEEAEPLLLQALDMIRKLLGDSHPNVAKSLHNLAGLYESQGRYKEAESLHLKALELWRKLLGDDHPEVATSLNSLAGLYYLQGRYEEAEPLFLQALELKRKLLGDNHPEVATSLNNLASLYYSQGRDKAAERLLLQALHLTEQLLGTNHPRTKISRDNLEDLRSWRST